MSNHQHQQQQPQPQKQPEPKAWAPPPDCIFFLLSDPAFEQRARAHLKRKYGAKTRCEVALNTQKISDRHTIVPVYEDPDRDIADPSVLGGLRARHPAERGPKGQVIKKAEQPEILEGAPIELKALWAEGAENDGAVQLTNLLNEHTGRFQLGLLSLIAEQVRPCVVHHRDDIHQITMATV